MKKADILTTKNDNKCPQMVGKEVISDQILTKNAGRLESDRKWHFNEFPIKKMVFLKFSPKIIINIKKTRSIKTKENEDINWVVNFVLVFELI